MRKFRRISKIFFALAGISLAAGYAFSISATFWTYSVLLSLMVALISAMVWPEEEKYFQECENLMANASAQACGSLVPAVFGNPRAMAYFESVSAQGRPLLKLELRGLRNHLEQETSRLDEATVQQMFSEHGIVLCS